MTKLVGKIPKDKRIFQDLEDLITFLDKKIKKPIEELVFEIEVTETRLILSFIGNRDNAFLFKFSGNLELKPMKKELFRLKLKKKKKITLPYELDSFEINTGVFKGKFKKKNMES